jgi:hypothetical protein
MMRSSLRAIKKAGKREMTTGVVEASAVRKRNNSCPEFLGFGVWILSDWCALGRLGSAEVPQ